MELGLIIPVICATLLAPNTTDITGTAAAARRASAPGDPFSLISYMRDSVGLDAGQIVAAERGNAVVKLLPTKLSRDVTVFGVIAVHTTREAYVARLGDAGHAIAFRSQRFGIISDPIAPGNLNDVSIGASEYRDLKSCRPDDCDFKLPAWSMREFANNVDWDSPRARTQVDSMLRLDLQRFVTEYRTGGNAAMVRYDDTHGVSGGDAFAALLSQSSYLREYAPEFRDYLAAYPARRPDGLREVTYWSETQIPRLRPTLAVNQMLLYTPASGPPLVARKQIYANHYFEAALELTGAFDAPSLPGGPGLYLVSVRRYRFDALPRGLFNIRGRVRDQLAKLAQSDLERERRSLEGPAST
jgi:hypothetical protein